MAARGRGVDPTLAAIEKLKAEREARRQSAENAKQMREADVKANEAAGRVGDVDFQRMIGRYREQNAAVKQEYAPPGDLKICVCVRKRPISGKEVAAKDYDSVTCMNPQAVVHACKLKVDGITKYLDNTKFTFDYAFDESADNDAVYKHTVQPLVYFMFRRGRSTVFAYGQTGSGKTYTMNGVQRQAAHEVFRCLESRELRNLGLTVHVTFFELYGGRCRDLLHERRKVTIREDGNGRVVAQGLEEVPVTTKEELLNAIKQGNAARTTHSTEANEQSSRSHAVCDIIVRDSRDGRLHGKVSLVDLAGSERGQDTKNHNRQRRVEGAEINKSLLALKECIRALGTPSITHVPFRASKLTLILKDSFLDKNARVVMVAAVSPAASSADHTLNTLRYAERLKAQDTGNHDDAPDAPVFTYTVAEPAVPPSPTAKKLVAAARAAREGKITEAEKERIKESIIREAPLLGAAGAAVAAAGAGRPSSANARDGARQPIVAGRRAGGERERPGAARPVTSDEADAARRKAQSLEAERQMAREREREYERDVRARARPQPLPSFLEEEHAAVRDLKRLHETLRPEAGASDELFDFHEAVEMIVEEEDQILAAHMDTIKENARMLSEEGQLLAAVQGAGVVDYDIDQYAARLAQILTRKIEMASQLKRQLDVFRDHLAREEATSRAVMQVPQY